MWILPRARARILQSSREREVRLRAKREGTIARSKISGVSIGEATIGEMPAGERVSDRTAAVPENQSRKRREHAFMFGNFHTRGARYSFRARRQGVSPRLHLTRKRGQEIDRPSIQFDTGILTEIIMNMNTPRC